MPKHVFQRFFHVFQNSYFTVANKEIWKEYLIFIMCNHSLSLRGKSLLSQIKPIFDVKLTITYKLIDGNTFQAPCFHQEVTLILHSPSPRSLDGVS